VGRAQLLVDFHQRVRECLEVDFDLPGHDAVQDPQ
jgi:hypothetical protein